MGNGNFDCEIVENADKGTFRAEIFELPDRELIATGPWAGTPKAARTAAVTALRKMLHAAEGVYVT